MNKPLEAQPAENFKDIFYRIGHLTRLLRVSMANLGLDRALMDVAEAMPDARDRLKYVVGKTTQAAECALTCVETARPLQDELSRKATDLNLRWDAWFDEPAPLSTARQLVEDTRQFLSDTPTIASQTNKHLMEIMMAQDFQDLTGQVIQNMMSLIENIENELVSVLVENMPEIAPQDNDPGQKLKNGPQINQTAAGIVASQDQVDDLLETLGF
ncbi:protein phosphatase CheZ [Pantoea sp.]|uniref:protein phosphatase CheZ n=1 Tax=Pantoea sp. TaxID=69393 RepID=UPI0028A04D02|nr:protein phosphatase CheZ [Pantoea sp.]